MPTDQKHCATTVKNQEIAETGVAGRKHSENKPKKLKNKPVSKTSGANISNPNSNVNNNNNNNYTKTLTEPWENQKLFTHLVKHVKQTNHSTHKCYFVANAANLPLPRHSRQERQNWVQERVNQSDSIEVAPAAGPFLN